MRKLFSNFILRLIVSAIILSGFDAIPKGTLVKITLAVFTLPLIPSRYEFFKYKEILNKESFNAGYLSDTSFDISRDEMTFLNSYTLISASSNQLIFLSAPNIMLNSYFLVIKNNFLTGEDS